MESPSAPVILPANETAASSGHVAVQRKWRKAAQLSSIADSLETFLSSSGFDRAPWLVVAFGCGIVAWFVFGMPWQWLATIGFGFLTAIAGFASLSAKGRWSNVARALIGLGVAFALGTCVIWLRSETVGAEPIERPVVERIEGYVLVREDQPARDRVRLTLAIRDAERGEARKVRVNVPIDRIGAEMAEGSVLRMRVRLMPPASPMLPGSYDFARAAWFKGLAATGSLIGEVAVVESSARSTGLAEVQRSLSGHVRGELDGSAGAIAAAFASGDRGGISEADDDAMRDAGLTHLLSISGLHVSAVIAAGYLLALKLLAFWPALALRVRLPVLAAGVGALAGIGYTLLTGSEVPTVRSCIAALLVLGALAMGREALSLRMVAVAAFAVLLMWPEAIVGPSFQMSFAAVIAIVALHNTEIVKRFLAPREESWLARNSRRTVMLLVTGFVIELALMPIVLFHFHRAGVYGALANVIAIPLVTFVSMPLIAIALVLDLAGLGAAAWWLVGGSLDLLIWIAHFTAEQPGAVKLMPQMSALNYALFLAGSFWLAFWQGRRRLAGFIPIGVGTIMLLATPVPDVLISNDGRHVGIKAQDGQLLSLRDSRSDYAKDNLLELASVTAEPTPLAEWPEAQCSRDFCALQLERGGREWNLLMARSRERIEERALAAACAEADIVVADRFLPRSCKPRWLKADGRTLRETGGLAIVLEDESVDTVASRQGEHGWWKRDR
ncbi:ComEC/Rec2 family competence protein [Altererythrobacter lutimaris]|uniref:ComEC/Rec2 family competence protein n=1 Tax=Altererythrobacter lutimaris TaxID=2743979 RepID=A0A850HAH8_9SPHN|nr:ComEC/Rec2 family competence protein [Altererythrobacter lutimaris]NVE93971.1 ComEC/Rec2 family competence protein [Altererythrobacter lutimaris]